MSFGPAAPRFILTDLDQCVPDMDSDDDDVVTDSSMAEHQTMDLAVTGSTPVPTTTTVGW